MNMPEMLRVYEPGERFVTMASNGHARIWEVDGDGDVHIDVRLEPKPVPQELRDMKEDVI